MDAEPSKATAEPRTNRRGGVRTRGGRLPPIMMRTAEPVKKSFAPNIPQRRARPKDGNIEPEIKRKDKASTGSTDRSRGRGSRRGRREYIQTVGAIFGGGLAPVTRKPSSDAKDRPTVYKPIFNRSKKKTLKEIDEMNKQLDGDFEEGDDSSSEYEDDSFANEIVRLPLRKTICNAIKKEVKTELRTKQEQGTVCKTEEVEDKSTENKSDETVTVKKEPEDIDQVTEEVAKIMSGGVVVKSEPIDEYPSGDDPVVDPKVQVKKEDSSQNDVKAPVMAPDSELLPRHDDELLFVQFPTRMPFENSLDDEPQPGPSAPRPTPAPDTEAGADLKGMQEGLIGKLQFLKSGDVRLCLGNATMGLHCENQLLCLLQAVTIKSHGDDDARDIAVLGNIEKSLLCYPVAEDCLRKVERISLTLK